MSCAINRWRNAGKAPWEIIGEVVRAVRVPVTGNGDVTSMAEARRMMAETGCASVMIGRGALGRPWVFEETLDSLAVAEQWERKTRVIARHLDLITAHFDTRMALNQTRKHLSWYSEGLPGSAPVRDRVHRSQSVEEATTAFWQFWELSRSSNAEHGLTRRDVVRELALAGG